MLLLKLKGSSGSTMLLRNTTLRCSAWCATAVRKPYGRRVGADGGD